MKSFKTLLQVLLKCPLLFFLTLGYLHCYMLCIMDVKVLVVTFLNNARLFKHIPILSVNVYACKRRVTWLQNIFECSLYLLAY